MKTIRSFLFLVLIASTMLGVQLFVVTPNLAFAQESPLPHWRNGEIETWLRSQRRTSDEIQLGVEYLTKRYLVQDRPQEAIWTLRFGGQFDRAEELEKELAERMSTERMTFEENLSDTDRGGKYKLRSRNLYGYFKSSKPFYIYEAIAYRLDRLLNLNIVPITIIRRHHFFSGLGSLQYFVRGAIENASSANNLADYRFYDYPVSQKKMWLLDFLIKNNDRHARNWFKRAGDQTVAIDHGHTFDREAYGNINMQTELLPDGETLEKLKQLSPSDFEDLLKLSDQKIDLSPLFERRDQVLKQIEMQKTERPSDPACSRLLAG